MKYKKIKIQWEKNPNFLNRTLLVRNDVDLFTLGVIVLESMCASFDDEFAIKDHKHLYALLPEHAEFIFPDENSKYKNIEDSGLKDLSNQFQLIYSDFEEPYVFDCEILEEQNKEGNQYAYLIDGKCRCLFDDNSKLLDQYAKGKVKKSSSFMDLMDKTSFPPTNISFNQLKEIEDFNLEFEQEIFNDGMDETLPDFVEYICEQYKSDYVDEDFDDDYYDEDDDFFDDDDDDHSRFIKSITEVCFGITLYQIENIPFVQKKFEQLSKKHSEEEAFLLISQVISHELENIITGDYFEENKEYERKIKNIK